MHFVETEVVRHILTLFLAGTDALRRPRPRSAGGTNGTSCVVLGFRFRRLTLRSATGTAQRAGPYLFQEQCQDAPEVACSLCQNGRAQVSLLEGFLPATARTKSEDTESPLAITWSDVDLRPIYNNMVADNHTLARRRLEQVAESGGSYQNKFFSERGPLESTSGRSDSSAPSETGWR